MQGVDPNANNIVGAAKMKLAEAAGDCFSVVRLEMQVEQELAGTQFTCFTTCVTSVQIELANAGGDCFSVVRLEMRVEQELAGTQFTCITTCFTSANEARECWRRFSVVRLEMRVELRDASGA
jgi:hypothetical protein